MDSTYTGKFLLGLEQATQLISNATKQPLRYARIEIAQAGSFEKFRLYDRWGKSNSLQWSSTVYKFDEVNGVEAVSFRDHYFVDLAELMDGMQIHRSIQDRIIKEHSAPTVAPQPGGNSASDLPKPLPRQRAQEQAIQRILRDLNYDPLQLPKNPLGKKGVKAEVKGKALLMKNIFTQKTFEKAWGRLSCASEISYKEVSP